MSNANVNRESSNRPYRKKKITRELYKKLEDCKKKKTIPFGKWRKFSHVSPRVVYLRAFLRRSIAFDFSEKLYIANHVAGYEPPREPTPLTLNTLSRLSHFLLLSQSIAIYLEYEILIVRENTSLLLPRLLPLLPLFLLSLFFPFSPTISLSLRQESHLIRSYLFLLMQFRLFAAIIFMLLSAKLIVSRYSFRSDAVENGLAYLRGNG